MAPKATRTLNPLHFEEPGAASVEDLIRQLAYDFRPWKRLEPTGRLGADDGIDIRGVEAALVEVSDVAEGDEEDDRPGTIERLWTIQCKREKSVHPADIKKIIDEAIPDGGQAPYGFILAAACDFSKRSRDMFIITLRQRGGLPPKTWSSLNGNRTTGREPGSDPCENDPDRTRSPRSSASSRPTSTPA